MMGAIIGDIVGSRFEFNNQKSKDFEFFTEECEFTDDTVMTLAAAIAVRHGMGWSLPTPYMIARELKEYGRKYPFCSYGTRFSEWLFSDDMQPYGSYGNGAGMRVSVAAWASRNMSECVRLSDLITSVTHSHPEGIKGARAIATSTFLALHGSTKSEIQEQIEKNYYTLDFSLDEIRDSYAFDETCQGTIPQAIVAFLEADSFEDAIRNAISIGGDSDTLAACTGAIAEAYFGIPVWMRDKAKTYLDRFLLGKLESIEETYLPKICI
jgi:type I restriction enzyme M protein